MLDTDVQAVMDGTVRVRDMLRNGAPGTEFMDLTLRLLQAIVDRLNEERQSDI